MIRFLVVDDSEFTRTIHRRLLVSEGIDVTEADCVETARQIADTTGFDGLLVDLLMPDGDGMELVHELRAANPELKIIVCSSDKQRARIHQADAAGAIFIPKPLRADGLQAALSETFPEGWSDE